MESTNMFGSDEDCRSCESGWTMYLASPFHDHEDDHSYYEDDNEEEEESDGCDSMESDASSGPMETTSPLEAPHQEIEEKNSKKKKKKNTNEDMVLVETTSVHNNTNDDDDGGGNNHDHDDGNDSYSVVHSYVNSI